MLQGVDFDSRSPGVAAVRLRARRGPFAIALAATILFASFAFTAQAELEAPRRATLPNGLTVLLAPDSTAVAVEVGVWYQGGARSEPTDLSGVTQILARLMYRGSLKYPSGDHARLLLNEGASLNTQVHPDYSCFSETVPPAALELALRLEADRMRGLRPTEEDFQTARAMLGQQQMEGSSLLDHGVERLYALSFRGDPYGRPVLGMPQDLSGLTLADVQRYYRASFGPENAVLTLVGRFDPTAALAIVRRTFGPVARGAAAPAKGKPKPRAGTRAVPEQRGERRETEEVRAQAALVFAGWRAPGYADPDGPALEVVSRILTGGDHARLAQTEVGPNATFLRTQGGFERSRAAGLFYCVAAVKPTSDTAKAESELVSLIERLATEPPSAAELEKARHQIESEILFGWQAVRVRAQALGTAQLLGGDYRLAQARLEKIRTLTARDVQRAASRVLTPDGRSVVWLVPPAGAGETEGGSR